MCTKCLWNKLEYLILLICLWNCLWILCLLLFLVACVNNILSFYHNMHAINTLANILNRHYCYHVSLISSLPIFWIILWYLTIYKRNKLFARILWHFKIWEIYDTALLFLEVFSQNKWQWKELCRTTFQISELVPRECSIMADVLFK